jgi:VIT1/CCC1 family predicted Fe2+/Mn2+ transporter
MAVANTLVLPGVPSPTQARRVFERSLIASLGSTEGATSVGYSLRALKMAGSAVRERLSQEHWRVMVRAEEELASSCAAQARSGDYPVQAALPSAVSFAFGAMLPLGVTALAPAQSLMVWVSGASLLFLAMLGATAAWAGGAGLLVGAWRVTFWGAVAMAITAGAEALFDAVV